LLAKWESALLQNPSAGFVFCGLDGKTKGTGSQQGMLFDIPPLSDGAEFFRRHFVAKPGSPVWGTVMARKAIYDKYMPFDPQFRIWADVDMWMRICQDASVAYVNEPLIILDNSVTAYRKFSWTRYLIVQRMALLNCLRMAERNPADRALLRRQRRWAFYAYRNHLASRLLKREFHSFWQGLRLLPSVAFGIHRWDFSMATAPLSE